MALQKWNTHRDDANLRPYIILRTDSQDAWIFKSPLREEILNKLDFQLGQPKCDNRLVYVLQEANYTVIDPAFAIRAIEIAYTAPLLYSTQNAVQGDVSDLLLSDELVF